MILQIKLLYKYRVLLSALVARHLSSRYRGSVLGFLWTLLNPLCLMCVYTLVFRYYMRFGELENYAVFLFCGLLPWIWISSSLAEATNSIVSSGHLVTKSAFPAHILPTVSVATNLINFLLSIPVLLAFALVSGVSISLLPMLLLPFVVLISFILTLGVSYCVSAVNVFYRDVQHIVGNLLSLLFFLCPIVYPMSNVPEKYHLTFYVNPISVLISMYHDILFYDRCPSVLAMSYVFVCSIGLLWVGSRVFEKYREQFAEML